MKKVILLALITFFSLNVNAQTDKISTYEYYIEVYIEWSGKNYLPHVYYENRDWEYIYDIKGEKLKFKSRSAIINYFSKLGWSFVQYLINSGESKFLLFKKQVKDEKEAKDGLIFKEDLK